MSILIKGVEMPTSCQSCFANEYQTCIFADKNASVNGKLLDCPLVPVPPHGRLIDADAPISLVDTHGKKIEVTVAHIIENNLGIVNAIIEAEENSDD